MSGNYKTIFQSVSEFAKFKWNAILQFSSKDSKRLTDDALKISLWYEPANTCEKKIRLLCQDEFTHLSFDKRIIINSHLYSNFELSVESNSELLWFCFLSFSDWFRRLPPLPQPIRFKLKPIATWSPAFFRALGSLLLFTLSSHWLLKYFPVFSLVVVATLVLVLRHSIRTPP